MNQPARLVVHYLGVACLLIIAGAIVLTGIGKVLPEWLKDPLLVGIGAIAGLLAKTGVDSTHPSRDPQEVTGVGGGPVETTEQKS